MANYLIPNDVALKDRSRQTQDNPVKPQRRYRMSSLVGLASLSFVIAACGSSSSGTPVTSGTGRSTTTTASVPIKLSAVEPSWQLRAPLSRMVVLPAGANKLVLLGGLTGADTSASGVFDLNLTNGQLKAIGNLPAQVHDAAGAMIGSQYYVFGGGSISTVSSVESEAVSGGNGSVVSDLPQPRSDLSAITVGNRTFIVGGYNGSSADPSVLVTSNGTSFATFSNLKVPVRYSALASDGRYIYVFGGLGVSGSRAGSSVSTIQAINLSTGVTKVIGSLPKSLEGAMAFSLFGHIYLAGGDSGSGNNLVSNSRVWEYSKGSKFTKVATLPVAVSNAGVAVSGNDAWLVGGEHNGKTVSTVQELKG